MDKDVVRLQKEAKVFKLMKYHDGYNDGVQGTLSPAHISLSILFPRAQTATAPSSGGGDTPLICLYLSYFFPSFFSYSLPPFLFFLYFSSQTSSTTHLAAVGTAAPPAPLPFLLLSPLFFLFLSLTSSISIVARGQGRRHRRHGERLCPAPGRYPFSSAASSLSLSLILSPSHILNPTR